MNVLQTNFIDELIDFKVSQKEVIIIEIISQQVLARADKKRDSYILVHLYGLETNKNKIIPDKVFVNKTMLIQVC